MLVFLKGKEKWTEREVYLMELVFKNLREEKKRTFIYHVSI